MNWIATKMRLPKKSGLYLVAIGNAVLVRLFKESGYFAGKEKIDFWTSIPKLPNKGGRK